MLFLDWGSNGWYNQYRDTNGYDTDGNLTSRVWESWDWTAWQGQSRYSWEYDSDANMISYLSEYWDGLSWVLNNSSFHITDSFGNHYTIGAGNANIYYGLVPLANEWGTDFPSNILQAQNFPNPFNPSTTIEYYLPEPTDVSLIIYDVTGREVNTLVSTSQSSGNYKVRWGGTNRDGLQVAAGMYFARLQAGEHQSVVKMVYLR